MLSKSSGPAAASISALALRIKRTMAPAVDLESMTQIFFSGCSSSTISRPMTAALYVPERLEEMVKHMVQSPPSKARAKAAGEGQAEEEADFSAAMASRRSGTTRSSLSRNSRAPTCSRRGTVSNRTRSLSKADMRRSQLLSLTIFQVI